MEPIKDALRLPAAVAELPRIRDYVLERTRRSAIGPDTQSRIDLVLEELLLNVANHAYGSGIGDVEAACFERDDGGARRFCLRLRDWGAPFDPLAHTAPSLEGGVEGRAVGGMGILLVTRNADTLNYERAGDANVVTACFDLPD